MKILLRKILLLLSGLTCIVLFQNCGVQKPQVENASALRVSFDHKPTPTSCSECHQKTLPPYYATRSADGISNLYIHNNLYGGASDCIKCHTESSADIGVTWQNGVFDHKLDTGTNVSNCSECHHGNKPTILVGAANFDHGTIGTQDCAVCHKNGGLNWASNSFNHTPTPVSCNSCHNSARPPSTQYIPSDSTKPTLNLYAHATQFNGGADCVSCHTSVVQNVGVTFAGGIYNHKTDTGATVSTCQDCHNGSRPQVPVGTSNFNHATSGQGDCFQCHKNAGGDWKTAVFSHTPTPTSCNSCHNSARPAPTVFFPHDPSKPTINLYAHASLYNGSADCVSCHTSVPANIGITFSGGVYNHKTNAGATVTTCQDCHSGSRPTVPVGSTNFDHTTSGQGDCYQCHKNVGANWVGNAVPANVTYPSPNTVSWSTITTAHPSTTSRPGMSCTTCHSSYSSTFSIKGFDHNAMPTGTKCVSCHTSGQQVVATTGLIFHTKSSTHEGGVSYTNDCNSCHNTSSFSQFAYPTWDATNKKFIGGKWK